METFLVLEKQTRALHSVLSQRHKGTANHCSRVGTLCTAMGQSCKLTAREIERLKLAARYHDLGKISIPDTILLKPAALDSEEWAVMKTHSARGAEIWIDSELAGSDEIATAIRHHHEKFDGTGYPDRLAGEGIPVCSRIVSVVDSYDALAEQRPYRAPKPHTEIMRLLSEQEGAMYDPYFLARFRDCIEKSPQKAN